MTQNKNRGTLTGWLLGSEWRAHPVRALVAIAAITLGVALGFAIDLINGAAFNEFSAAVRSLSGQSDLQVRGSQSFLSEKLYPLVSALNQVAVASPVVQIDAVVSGQRESLKVIGIDVFKAAQVAPDLIGVAAPDRPFDMLADDAIFLSPAAMASLNLKIGDSITFEVGAQTVRLRVAGGVARARPGQRIGVMDLGAAQWRFNRLGQLSWLDLKLVPGTDVARFKHDLPAQLGVPIVVTSVDDQEARTNNMSRAYRVNLNVLALVALFTGAFLVFSTQALAVIRRRPQLALLRVLGLQRRQLLKQILLEGGLLGLIGSLLGLLGGFAVAAAALHFFGGDLGGGYFQGIKPSVYFDPIAAVIFLVLGTGVALLGSLAPAWEAAQAPLAAALKAGSEEMALAPLGRAWPGLLCLIIGGLLTLAPPVFGLPIYGYIAVALILVGGIALMPRFASWVFHVLASLKLWKGLGALPTLTLGRLANAPNQAAIALGGVLSSFSLMVAMAIMVASFRVSVDDWLVHILSADLYIRAASANSGNNNGSNGNNDSASFTPLQQQSLSKLSGVMRADFQRVSQLTLDPRRPSVALIARPIALEAPERTLPMTNASMRPDALKLMLKDPTLYPAWVSEAMVDLYGYQPGKVVTLAIGQTRQRVIIAGVWRDYARQNGAIQMRLQDYQAVTNDNVVNDIALHLRPGTSADTVIAAARALPFGAALAFAVPGEIQALSLKIFDRSFAVTYLLEVVAVVIGLFGVAATFSAQTLARAREFGMLRHLGLTRRQLLILLAAEGSLLTAIGIGAGFVIGFCISLILVFIVNPQSFHWTMQLHVPWRALLTVSVLLLLSAGLTALLSGRVATSGGALRAVREDW
jgi:putative ABC transport system permease protein